MKAGMVLIVEDDPVLRDLTKRQLSKLGFQCKLANSGESAIGQADADVRLIFMDIGLPGIDGILATELIRKKERQENREPVPIIALTGHADRKRVIEGGLNDFVQKPALINDIKRIVDKWLDQPSSDAKQI